MEHRRKNSRNEESPHDFPPYSRLFIVCDKKLTEDQFNEAFSSFGHIEDIRMPRDRNTGDTKGIVYIKFSKTSEAAVALEEMNKKVMSASTRPLKVMVAANRSDIQTEDNEQKYRRLFITVPLDIQEDDIKKAFSPYGHISDIYFQRDRHTGEPNGFAYVTYTRFSEAATAYEKSHPKFRAIFALPKDSKQHKNYDSNKNTLPPSCNVNSSLLSAMNVSTEGYTCVEFMCSPYLTQMHVEKLFDLIPGFLNCKYIVDLMNGSGNGTATYSNPTCAAFAVQKLNRFEYPPGTKVFVRPSKSMLQNDRKFGNIPNLVRNIKDAIAFSAQSSSPDLVQLAETIAEASKLLKTATLTANNDNVTDSAYCSVKLPPPQPLADIDSPLAKRCFLVCKPEPPPLAALRDVFCRFGDLINVYTLPGKTIGYARYASNSAADNAIKTLHGVEICGVRIKVIEAEDEAPPKKKKYSD